MGIFLVLSDSSNFLVTSDNEKVLSFIFPEAHTIERVN